jgi:retron-type reverse transcriptase
VGSFDNIDHNVLLEILARDIQDNRFLKLIRQMLKGGYLEDWRYHETFSGTPQGGLCKALHNPPYAKKANMQSNGPKHGIFAVFGRFTLHNNRTYFNFDNHASSS